MRARTRSGLSTPSQAISVSEMRAIEENSEYLGVSRLILMENAGREVAREVVRKGGSRGKHVLVVAHTGNKAGDGFVAARYLASSGASVELLLVGDPDDIRSFEARTNWRILRHLDQHVKIYKVSESSEIRGFFSRQSPFGVIIDALLGTGLRGDLKEPLITAVREINRLRASAIVVAIDVPTGLDPDTGVVHGDAIRAHLTVTHHRIKTGLLKKGAKEYTGKLILANIGLPPEAEFFAGPGDLRRVMRARSTFAHKGDSGRLLVVAGSKRYSGSAGLCGLAALRTGVDLVTLLAPEAITRTLQSFSPDLIIRSTPGEVFGLSALPPAKELMSTVHAAAIGPGLGLEVETRRAVIRFLAMCRTRKIPVVIDADAVKALRRNHSALRGMSTVLTPHAGEFGILTGAKPPPESESALAFRSALVKRWAGKLKSTVLLKGHYSIISDGVRTRVNRTGNPGMTVGGTGDVLTGITAAFLAWGNGCMEAATAAAFLSGAVGDYVASFKGYHLLASDLVEAIPKVLSRYDLNSPD